VSAERERDDVRIDNAHCVVEALKGIACCKRREARYYDAIAAAIEREKERLT